MKIVWKVGSHGSFTATCGDVLRIDLFRDRDGHWRVSALDLHQRGWVGWVLEHHPLLVAPTAEAKEAKEAAKKRVEAVVKEQAARWAKLLGKRSA